MESQHETAEAALAAFERMAVSPERRHYSLGGTAPITGPAPYRVVKYNTLSPCGVALYDAAGKCWRDAGIFICGKRGG